MDKQLINKLLKAGVDAQTILTLVLDDDTAAETPETSGDTGAESAADTPAGNQTPDAAEAPAQNDAILAAINKLTGAIQASNILNMGGSTPPATSIDDVMKKLIQPDKPAGKE